MENRYELLRRRLNNLRLSQKLLYWVALVVFQLHHRTEFPRLFFVSVNVPPDKRAGGVHGEPLPHPPMRSDESRVILQSEAPSVKSSSNQKRRQQSLPPITGAASGVIFQSETPAAALSQGLHVGSVSSQNRAAQVKSTCGALLPAEVCHIPPAEVSEHAAGRRAVLRGHEGV